MKENVSVNKNIPAANQRICKELENQKPQIKPLQIQKPFIESKKHVSPLAKSMGFDQLIVKSTKQLSVSTNTQNKQHNINRLSTNNENIVVNRQNESRLGLG